jgi:hypothetical protein
MQDLLALAVVSNGWNMAANEHLWPGFASVHTPPYKDEDEARYRQRDNEFRMLVWPWWIADQMVMRKHHYELWKKEYQGS